MHLSVQYAIIYQRINMQKKQIWCALELLNRYLGERNETRNLTICGGASLILQELTDRGTEDVDIVAPRIDAILKELSLKVATELGNSPQWINGGAAHYTFCLPEKWEERTEELFTSNNLNVYTLSRFDILCMKFFASFERPRDFDDLKSIHPTHVEIDKVANAMKNILNYKHDENFKQKVDKLASLLKKELAND